jgi:hypothetical protein
MNLVKCIKYAAQSMSGFFKKKIFQKQRVLPYVLKIKFSKNKGSPLCFETPLLEENYIFFEKNFLMSFKNKNFMIKGKNGRKNGIENYLIFKTH